MFCFLIYLFVEQNNDSYINTVLFVYFVCKMFFDEKWEEYMKYRSDFVTNSSSSSFVLAYQTENDWQTFLEECSNEYCSELVDFIVSCRDNQPSDYAEKMREQIIEFMYVARKRDLEDLYFERHPCSYQDVDSVRHSDEFQNFIKDGLKDARFLERVQKVQNADVLVYENVWDSDGDLLFFAIRRGYLRETPARKYLVTQLDVG